MKGYKKIIETVNLAKVTALDFLFYTVKLSVMENTYKTLQQRFRNPKALKGVLILFKRWRSIIVEVYACTDDYLMHLEAEFY